MATNKNTLPDLDFNTSDTGLPDLEFDNVKKKESTEEELASAETSLKGYSVAPNDLVSEAPSTTNNTKQETTKEEPKATSKIDDQVNQWYDVRGGMSPVTKIDKYSEQISNLVDVYNDKSEQFIEQGMTPEQIGESFEAKSHHPIGVAD